jgi:hypothetical protein
MRVIHDDLLVLTLEAASQQADIHSFRHQPMALIVRMNAIARIVCRMEHGFIISRASTRPSA